jgi:hypothetical protein
MHRPTTRSLAIHAATLAAALLVAAPVHAQSLSTWRISAGAGAATPTDADLRRFGNQPALRIGIERRVTDRFALGAEWIGTVFDGDYGPERRHNVGFTATAYPAGPIFVSAGFGVGVATNVMVDGPPAECCGDVVIGIADPDMGAGFTAAAGLDIPIARGFSFAPMASVAWQRIPGQTVGFTWLGARLSYRW